LRITEDGTVQIGRKRGVGSTARLLNNDPTQVDALFMEREDPLEPGSYNSDFFKITAKSRQGTIIKRHDWRLNVQLGKQGSSLVVGFAQNEAESEARISFHENGAVELLGPGAGLILRSPGGGRWHLTVDDRGQLTTETRP
jgi:hypothetical protein